MALLFVDSFDHYATADLLQKWTASAATGTGASIAIGATGRHTSNSVRYVTGTATTNAASGSVQKTLAGLSGATAIVGVAVRLSGAPGSNGLQLLLIRDGTATQIAVRITSGLTLQVVRGTAANDAGTTLGTTTVTLSAGLYAYVELKVLIHASAGTVDLRVNGVSALSLTGQNTLKTAVAQWTGLALGHADVLVNSTSGTSVTLDCDDLYVCDGSGGAPWNTFLGDCRVDARYPTAEGASSAWTPSAGTDNALMVNETAPDGDTTYTSAASSPLTDTHVMQDVVVSGALIYGLQHCLSMKKSDAGACTVVPVIRHAGVDYPGAALAPGGAYAYGLAIAATNPGTAAAWTETDLNAAECGYRRTA